MAAADSSSGEQDHFDLLPFIAIMMCLLGTLLLVTMSLAAINVGAGAGEGWVPQSAPGAKAPVLIEWDGRYAAWHNETGIEKLEVDFLRVAPHGLRSGTGALDPLLNYLEAHGKDHYALFAVRPDGFANFRQLAALFETRQIEIGSEPLEAGKPVKLMLPAEAVK